MRRPTLLALDVGGVLAVDALKPLFAELEQAANLDPGPLYAYYSHNLRQDLWSGRGPEQQFFAGICGAAGVGPDGYDHWRDRLLEIMQPLPAIKKVAKWAEEIDLAILSNHRHEWLRPLLTLNHIDTYVPAERLFISSEVGAIKPDPAAFGLLTALRHDPAEILYVDDQLVNVEGARSLGIDAIQADANGDWVNSVDERLALSL